MSRSETYAFEAEPGTNSRTGRNGRRWAVFDTFVSGMVRNDDKENLMLTYDCTPPPFFIISISLIQLIVLIVYAVELNDTDDPVTWRKGFPIDNPLIYKPSKRHEVWRWITYMLVHDGWSHLVGNLVTQLLLGLVFEMAHEWKRLLPLYMIGVLAGSLCHSIVDYNVNLVGASGGTFALLGAHLSSAIIASALSFGLAIYERYYDDDNINSKVGIAAHVGGLVAGLFLGLSIVKNTRVLIWEEFVGKAFLVLFVIIFVGAIFFNIFYDGYPPMD